MAYETANSDQGLGFDLTDVIAKGGPALKAAAKIIEDPSLAEITCHVLRLNKITTGKDPGPPCPRVVLTPDQKRKGVGLHIASTPLRLVVWGRAHPVLAIGIGIGALGLIWGFGFLVGRRRRRP